MNTESAPFEIGQQVVAIVGDHTCGIKKGKVYTVSACFKECCWWHIDVGVIATFSEDLICSKCHKGIFKIRKGKPLCPQAICFRAVQDQYADIRAEIAASHKDTKEVPDRVRVEEPCGS